MQELIAPSVVVFYERDWDHVGTKSDLALWALSGSGPDVVPCSHLSRQERYLSEVLEDCSVAQRLSWASRRKTTRAEDAVYCLLGIFGVNLPLLYGEGFRAFVRLHEEIIKILNDQFILA
ncbi:hypothetical protein B0H66DRAFT_446285, partial [Apodospora peruviana]